MYIRSLHLYRLLQNGIHHANDRSIIFYIWGSIHLNYAETLLIQFPQQFFHSGIHL